MLPAAFVLVALFLYPSSTGSGCLSTRRTARCWGTTAASSPTRSSTTRSGRRCGWPCRSRC
ncbi:hypothetical protein ACFQU7_22630 [Pseudoroseomonas wenyumeiae]